MITAETIQRLSNLATKDLTKVLDTSGYSTHGTGLRFESNRFLGITKDGDFCYEYVYFDDTSGDCGEVGKVFVRLDQDTGELTADF